MGARNVLLKAQYRLKDLWQLVLKQEKSGQSPQAVIRQCVAFSSIHGAYSELDVRKIGLSIAALLNRWPFPLPKMMNGHLRDYILQTAEKMVNERPPVYRVSSNDRDRPTIAYFDKKSGSVHSFRVSVPPNVEQSREILPELPPNVVFGDTQAQKADSQALLGDKKVSFHSRLVQYLCFRFHGLITTSEELSKKIQETIAAYTTPPQSQLKASMAVLKSPTVARLEQIQRRDDSRNNPFRSFASTKWSKWA